MAKIEGLNTLIAKLRERAAKSVKDDNCSVVVGFTQAYAIYVHENLEAHHAIGQAKYLEQPFRENRQKLADIVFEAMRQGKTLAQGLVLAGLWLQATAQKLAPVDTGALKASAFTRLERSDGQTEAMK